MTEDTCESLPLNREEAKERVRKDAAQYWECIAKREGIAKVQSPKVIKSDEQVTDLLRLNDLVQQHGLRYQRVGSTYSFEDFTAHGLKQALGFAEGFDRAKSEHN